MGGSWRHPSSIGPKQGIFEVAATAAHRVGERIQFADGSVYYYAKASEAITKGTMCTFLAKTFTEDTVTVAHAIGVTDVTITASAAIASNELAEGILVVDEGTGAGDSYKIKSNPAISNGTTGVVTLYDPLRTAWAIADTDITIYTNPFSGIQIANDGAECPAGVPRVTVAINEYFWIQTWGFACVYVDGTTNQLGAINTERSMTLAAAAVDVYTAIGAGAPYVGQVLVDGVDMTDAQYAVIMLQIMP